MNEETKQDDKKVNMYYVELKDLLEMVERGIISKAAAMKQYVYCNIKNFDEYYEYETSIAQKFSIKASDAEKILKKKFHRNGTPSGRGKEHTWVIKNRKNTDCSSDGEIGQNTLSQNSEIGQNTPSHQIGQNTPSEIGQNTPSEIGYFAAEIGQNTPSLVKSIEENKENELRRRQNTSTTFNSDSCMEELFSSDDDSKEVVELEVKEDSNSFQLEGSSHYHKKGRSPKTPNPLSPAAPFPQPESIKEVLKTKLLVGIKKYGGDFEITSPMELVKYFDTVIDTLKIEKPDRNNIDNNYANNIFSQINNSDSIKTFIVEYVVETFLNKKTKKVIKKEIIDKKDAWIGNLFNFLEYRGVVSKNKKILNKSEGIFIKKPIDGDYSTLVTKGVFVKHFDTEPEIMMKGVFVKHFDTEPEIMMKGVFVKHFDTEGIL